MKRPELIAILLISVVGLPSCFGALIGQPCTNSEECPNYSECKKSRCDTVSSDKKCSCVSGFFPLKNGTGCQTVVNLNETCDNVHLCRAGSYCGHNDKCMCKDGHQPCKDNLRCKPNLPGTPVGGRTFMAMYMEPCDDRVMCFDEFGSTECRAHKCRCADGFRPRTENDELLSMSMAGADCLPTSFTEEFCS